MAVSAIPLCCRTQNSEMVGSGRSVHNGFSTHAVDKYVQHAPHADKSHLQKLGSSGWTHDGFDQRYGTFQDGLCRLVPAFLSESDHVYFELSRGHPTRAPTRDANNSN